MSINNIYKHLFINSRIYVVSLLFMVYALQAIAAPQHHKAKKKGVVHSMTVLLVNLENNNEPYIGVIFQVSQRRYKLPKDANPAYLQLLKESQHDHTPVLVERAKEESDIIVSVKKP